ncbi:hypothetical protein PENSPDRAFT_688984 [Peniophora sp. CONT]|nr:hypothetical protein PENSPDRAFT_688984 [Peniophora sp. CONT]
MAPGPTVTSAPATALASTIPTPYILGTSIAMLALLTTIIILLALVLRFQALQLRRTRTRVQSIPSAVARVPVFFAASASNTSETRMGGKRKAGKKEAGDKGASRRTSAEGEMEEVELDVLEYGRRSGSEGVDCGSAL